MFYRTFLCHQGRAKDVCSGGNFNRSHKRRKRRKQQAAAERGIGDPPELCSFISSLPQLVCAVLSRTMWGERHRYPNDSRLCPRLPQERDL